MKNVPITTAEDALFKVLSRPSYWEIHNILMTMPIDDYDKLFQVGSLDSFLEMHHWTWEEFSEEHTKHTKDKNGY